MKALVVNCSAPHYNLGAAKLADWLSDEGYQVLYDPKAGDPGMFANGFDLVALSVIFSWHAPVARRIALQVKAHAKVWAGGPGLAALSRWWGKETGLSCTVGLDPRFERQRGSYEATFASRGCPVGCWFCIVPKIEGMAFTLYEDFQPAPILCDNNLSALPVAFQEHIIARYQETETPLLDANSGFEPRSFNEDTYLRWKATLRGPWRFALDEMGELEDVERMMEILRPEKKKKRVYVLIGNEPFEACMERAQKVIEWRGEPYCQPIRALNALTYNPPLLRHGWNQQGLTDFARYFNRHLYRKVRFEDYDRSVRTNR